MQIPVLNGVYVSTESDFRTSYPLNLYPVPKDTGIASGYLRPAEGIVSFGTGPGVDRGGINWNGVCYRVMGEDLVSIDADGNYTTIGSVEPGGPVDFDYSFDRMAVASGGSLYYYNGTTFVKVTDVDLGTVKSVIWVDGYFMTTDGESLVVTELTDPTSVNPLKYGSSEYDPDGVKRLIRVRHEVLAVNRYTIETFQDVGGENFPFERVPGAVIMRGAVGDKCACRYDESVAFVGGGRNEGISVWLASSGAAVKISTREIDQILRSYTERELASIEMEARILDAHQFLYIHLADKTLVYDAAASQVVGQPVWFMLSSSLTGDSEYLARHFVWCYDKWLCGNTENANIGYLTDAVSSHYGNVVGWSFGTTIVYNDALGAIFHELELVCLTGNIALGAAPQVTTSYSNDGLNWSTPRSCPAGTYGERLRRIAWMKQGHMRKWRIQRFSGTSDAHLSIARLEARLEAMNV